MEYAQAAIVFVVFWLVYCGFLATVWAGQAARVSVLRPCRGRLFLVGLRYCVNEWLGARTLWQPQVLACARTPGPPAQR